MFFLPLVTAIVHMGLCLHDAFQNHRHSESERDVDLLLGNSWRHCGVRPALYHHLSADGQRLLPAGRSADAVQCISKKEKAADRKKTNSIFVLRWLILFALLIPHSLL